MDEHNRFCCPKCGWNGIVDNLKSGFTFPIFCPNCGTNKLNENFSRGENYKKEIEKMSRINFEHDFKPTSTQEILTFEYSNYTDYEKTIELLDRLPVRYMLHRPGRGLSSDTGLFIDVIVPKKKQPIA